MVTWKIKQYHEAPISIFKQVQQQTDGDYALVHLFESNPEYFKMFREAVVEGRDVLLDNSLYELRNAFDTKRFVYWIQLLKPTWFIVPDSWKNGSETKQMFFNFINKYGNQVGDSKIIGVAQGNTVEEVADCYAAIEPYCDKIAFNLDFATASSVSKYGVPYCLRMSIGRHEVLTQLYENGIINPDKPHHLLGCGVPQEMLWYNPEWTWVDSVDTCNPVLHGMYDITYDEKLPGLLSKIESVKMCDLMNDEISKDKVEKIRFNIAQMTDYCTKTRI